MTGKARAGLWWREPMMWLVVGGPLSVVLACAITAVIAWRGADPVLAEATDAGHAQAMQPALAARNRGAAPK